MSREDRRHYLESAVEDLGLDHVLQRLVAARETRARAYSVTRVGVDSTVAHLLTFLVNRADHIGVLRDLDRRRPLSGPAAPTHMKQYALEADLAARADDKHAAVFDSQLSFAALSALGEMLSWGVASPLILNHFEPRVLFSRRSYEHARNELPNQWKNERGAAVQVLELCAHGTLYRIPFWLPVGWQPLRKPEARPNRSDEDEIVRAMTELTAFLRAAAETVGTLHKNPVGKRQILSTPILFSDYEFGFPQRKDKHQVPLDRRLTPGISGALARRASTTHELVAFRLDDGDADPNTTEVATGNLMLPDFGAGLQATERLKDIATTLLDVERGSEREEAILRNLGLERSGALIETEAAVEWLHWRSRAAITDVGGAVTVRVFLRLDRPLNWSAWAIPFDASLPSLTLIAIERRLSDRARMTLADCVRRYLNCASSLLAARAGRGGPQAAGVEGMTALAYLLNLIHESDPRVR